MFLKEVSYTHQGHIYMILKQRYCKILVQFDNCFLLQYMDIKWCYVENNCASLFFVQTVVHFSFS